jgi:4-hydroxybenzoate polyprenyl transferase
MKFLAGNFAPDILSQLRNYAKLMRLDRPIGIWLLLWPTLWALWLAGEGHPDPGLFVIFVLGVVVMRSAGCVLNDFVDRNIDPYVERTRDRPIASGAVKPLEALTLFAALGFIAVGLATMLNRPAQLLAVAAAALTIAYPFVKRFVSIPQFILGAAFGWAAPMAFAAHTGGTPQLAWLVFGAALVWAVWRVLRHRDMLALTVSMGVLAGWVPWLPYAYRTIFTFYSVAFAPFMVLTRRIRTPNVGPIEREQLVVVSGI